MNVTKKTIEQNQIIMKIKLYKVHAKKYLTNEINQYIKIKVN